VPRKGKTGGQGKTGAPSVRKPARDKKKGNEKWCRFFKQRQKSHGTKKCKRGWGGLIQGKRSVSGMKGPPANSAGGQARSTKKNLEVGAWETRQETGSEN